MTRLAITANGGHRVRRTVCAAAFFCTPFLGGCDVFAPADGGPASIEIVPSEVSLTPGDTVQLTYVVRDSRGRVLDDISMFWNWSDASVASLDHTGRLVARAPGLIRITAQGNGLEARAYAAVGSIRFDNVREHALAIYRSGHGLELTHPPIVIDTTARDTNLPKPPTRFISTVYTDTRRIVLEMWPDGRVISSAGPRVRPIGELRIAVLVIDHQATNFAEVLDTHWRAAIDSVNAELRDWAVKAGHPGALLSFRVTTLLVPVGTFHPEAGHVQQAYLDQLGIEYDAFGVVNLNPADRWGGLYWQGGLPWVYVGCHCEDLHFSGTRELTPAAVHDIARTFFHHEIGHAMGWAHSWGGGPPGTRLITNPALFGWTDLTGDGFIEILSPNPYGAAGRLP